MKTKERITDFMTVIFFVLLFTLAWWIGGKVGRTSFVCITEKDLEYILPEYKNAAGRYFSVYQRNNKVDVPKYAMSEEFFKR